MGFEKGGFSLQTNLLFNFIWYLVLCLLMMASLNSEFGKSAMFMSFIKLVSFVPIKYSLCLVFWKMFGWMSGNHLMRRASSEVWGFIWVSALVLFMTFILDFLRNFL